MTSIFEGQPLQNKALSIQNKGRLGSRMVYYGIFTYMKTRKNQPFM